MAKGTWDELTKLINKYINRNKSKEGVVGIFTKKQIGNYPAVGIRMTNPLNRRDLALTEMTRERQYFLFKNYEQDVLKNIIKALEHVDKNNIQLGGELLKNLEYNFGIVKMLRKYNLKSEGIIRSGGSTPSKVLKDEAKAGPGEGIRSLKGSMQDLESSIDEIMKLADELRPETIAKKEAAEKAIRQEEFKKLYHGRAYQGRSDQYRGLSYQLAKLHEAGIIKLDDKIYDGIKEGKYHWGGAEFHTPDPNRVWRYHFGDEIFDKFDEVLEKFDDDTFIGPNAMETWMKKEGIKPINVKGHKNALDYMDEVELLQNIKNNDASIKRYKSGKDHFWSGMENEKENVMQSIMGLAEQNKKLLDIFKIKSPKNYENYIKTKGQKPDKTLEEALKEGDYTVISQGDEGFKEISEKLGITAKPGDNLKLEDNVIEGPWEGSSKSTAPGTYSITDHIEYIKTLEPIEAMKEANKVLKGEGRYKGLSKADQETIVNDETVTDHIFERNVEPDPEDFAQGGRVGFDGGGSQLQKLRQAIVESMRPYAPGVSEDKLQLIVKDITIDMSPEQAQASAISNFKKHFGSFAQGGRVGYSMGSGGELEDLLQRLGMVVDGLGIYSDYNQTQRKQMQRSLTNRINVLLGN